MRLRVGPLAAVLAAVCLGARGAAVDASRFRYAAELALPASGQEELAELVLPPDAYRTTRNDLADLCVIRKAGGEAVPFLVECVTEEREERVRQSVGLHMVKAGELDGKRFQVTLERDPSAQKQEPLCGVVIHTTLRDFERLVTVEASPDCDAWQLIVRDARILDLSSHADFSLMEIRLPAVTQRYVRLTVDRMDEVRAGASATVTTSADAEGAVRNIERRVREEQRPFRIDRVDGWLEQSRWVRDARSLVPRGVRVVPGVPAELKSRYAKARLVCFEAGRVPLERVKTRSAKSVLSLAYILFEQADKPHEGASEWRQVAAGDVTRLAFRDFVQERMEIPLAESRASAYCLVLKDGEGASDVEVTGGAGPDYRVIFPYGAGQACSLLAGASEASGPTGYQPEQIRALLRRGIKPRKASLEGWSDNPAWRRTGSRFFSAEAAWLLPAAVVLAIIVLGCAVAVALRRVPG